MPDVETIVYSNDPARVLPVLESELEDFQTEAARYLNGEWPEAQFIGFRLKQGVYGQRQPNVQMIRVQAAVRRRDARTRWKRSARWRSGSRRCARATSPRARTSRSTTCRWRRRRRRCSSSGKAGLSTREACGNTVRNVTGDPWAGVQQGELFDPTPYAGAFARYWLRNPISQLLPRKFKVAFTATDADNAITGIHDLGFIPRIENGVKGFKIVVGGGLSIMPRNAPVLREFSPVDEYLQALGGCGAHLREGGRAAEEPRQGTHQVPGRPRGDRRVQAHGRRRTRRATGRTKDFRPDRLLYVHDEEANAPAQKPRYEQPNGDQREFTAFVTANVRAQKQQGFSAVEVKVTARRPQARAVPRAGDASCANTAAAMRARQSARTSSSAGCATKACTRCSSGSRTWAWPRSGAQSITDVVSCPGTDSCKLGITSSMGLNQAIQQRVEALEIQRPADAENPHQDERLPEQLRTAPHREHRFPRRCHEGWPTAAPGLPRIRRRFLRQRQRCAWRRS